MDQLVTALVMDGHYAIADAIDFGPLDPLAAEMIAHADSVEISPDGDDWIVTVVTDSGDRLPIIAYELRGGRS